MRDQTRRKCRRCRTTITMDIRIRLMSAGSIWLLLLCSFPSYFSRFWDSSSHNRHAVVEALPIRSSSRTTHHSRLVRSKTKRTANNKEDYLRYNIHTNQNPQRRHIAIIHPALHTRTKTTYQTTILSLGKFSDDTYDCYAADERPMAATIIVDRGGRRQDNNNNSRQDKNQSRRSGRQNQQRQRIERQREQPRETNLLRRQLVPQRQPSKPISSSSAISMPHPHPPQTQLPPSPPPHKNDNVASHDSWLDRTTARMLMLDEEDDYYSTEDDSRGRQIHLHPSPSSQEQRRQLTSGDVALITSLMASHARRGTVESAIMCERLLRRVVMEVDYNNSQMVRNSSGHYSRNEQHHITRNGESYGDYNEDSEYDNDDDDGGWSDIDDDEVRVTTKMYTVCIDAWSKCQSRPFLRDSISDGNGGSAFEGKPHEQSPSASSLLQPPPTPPLPSLAQPNQQHRQRPQQKLPLGAAAQRAHRIHNSLVQMYKQTGDIYLAPSTISYNAAINAWSKSYHPSAGEMAELLLGEMMREWKFGTSVTPQRRRGSQTPPPPPGGRTTRGNNRVKPDVVTFTAVIDAWVKCTALAAIHENQHHDGKTDESTPATESLQRRHPSAETTAASADEVTKRAAVRAKEILKLMISLGHYSEDNEDKCEPGMRPNCYTYSAVMNALAKSCSSATTSRGMAASTTGKGGKNRHLQQYDPAREAQDMLEDMLIKYRRYKERVGEVPWMVRKRLRYKYAGDSQFEENCNDGDEGKRSALLSTSATEDDNAVAAAKDDYINDPNWFEPRLDEITFPPNTVNYNAVLNAWSRASRYDPYAAVRAENILLKRMEASPASPSLRQQVDNQANFDDGLDSDAVTIGGDDVEPDALSYSLVIHAWLRGCRGVSGNRDNTNVYRSTSNPQRDSLRNVMAFSNLDRIERAIAILDRLEAWARRTRGQYPKWRRGGEGGLYNNDHGNNERVEGTRTELDFDIAEDYMSTNDKNILGPDDIMGDEEEEEDESSYNSGYQSSGARRPASSSESFRQHDKARDLDVEVYNSILLALSRDQQSNIDHAARVMLLLDRMENLANELNMPSVRPNLRSYNIALGVISNSAARVDTSLSGYYKNKKNIDNVVAEDVARCKSGEGGGYKEESNNYSFQKFNPLYAGKAAESILGRMMAQNYRPDAYTFASVLNTYQRIPDGKLDAALAADAVVRGMESLYFHGRIDFPPDVFHYTMVCACWSRSGQQGMAGERCSQILSHMQERDREGFPRVRPNIRTFNAIIDSYAYNDRVAEAEDMLLSMIANYESSAARSMDGIEDEELPVRPDVFSFNTVIQQWARSRTPEGGKRAEAILDKMIEFHQNGNADIRPDERSFASIIYHYTKGTGRMDPKAPDRALKLLRRMIGMYRQGYKEIFPSFQNKTNSMYTFTSVIDAHSVLRRPNSGIVAEELLQAMSGLSMNIDALRPNTYTCLSVLYAWSSCGSVDAGERATKLLHRMECDMAAAAKRGDESRMKTTQRCYILAQTAWARSPSERKADGAMEVLEMMEKSFSNGNMDVKPTVQAYSMVLNACAFSDVYQDEHGNLLKSSQKSRRRAFHIAELAMNRIRAEPYPQVLPNPVIYGTFIKCCGRLDLPEDVKESSAISAFEECCQAGLVSDFVLTQFRSTLSADKFVKELVRNGYSNVDRKGKSLSRDGKRVRHIGIGELPKSWTINVR